LFFLFDFFIFLFLPQDISLRHIVFLNFFYEDGFQKKKDNQNKQEIRQGKEDQRLLLPKHIEQKRLLQ